MTPADLAQIRAVSGYVDAPVTLALCDSLEQAWADAEEWRIVCEAAGDSHRKERERAERAEALHAEFYALADKQAAALARVRALCDGEWTIHDYAGEPIPVLRAESLRAAIEGDNR